MARWDSAQYQRIADVSLNDDILEVSFANGDSVSVSLPELISVTSLAGVEVIPREHDIVVRSPKEDDRFISWLSLRVLTDPEFASHLDSVERDEANRIGLTLRHLREARGLSSKEVAERAGISAQSMSRIELGRHDVVFSTLRKILSAMNYELRDLADAELGNGYTRDPMPAKETSSRRSRGNMTKQQFVDRVASKANLSRRDAAAAVDAFLDSITEALRSGKEVSFTGFGKFSVEHRKARFGVNPRNPSQKVAIPAATVPKFSGGSVLKNAVKTSRSARQH
jgi:DNA-binding protein HU-beta